jgi:3-hydroxyisobutyrate dehydrogenase-like beta-hydroxyacid dehydrogenase
MGSSLAAALGEAGHQVYWLAAGRSEATRRRAERSGARPLADETDLVGFDAVVSVCPPDAAMALAEAVIAKGFTGIFVDANAVAPATARAIGRAVGNAGCAFTDGGIIGPPAWKPGTTRLYLAGPDAEIVAGWFAGSVLQVQAIGTEVGAASALKMCYAAFTKGSSALLLGVRALAEAEGVQQELLAEWEISQPGLAARSASTASAVAPKGWRFVGEMREIAATFESRGLPGGFHCAAADLFQRLEDFKDVTDADVSAVLRALISTSD